MFRSLDRLRRFFVGRRRRRSVAQFCGWSTRIAAAVRGGFAHPTAPRLHSLHERQNNTGSAMSEMSVSISPNGGDRTEPAAARKRTAAANASDLDLWLEKVEAMGELKRITAEVDPDLEAATI